MSVTLVVVLSSVISAVIGVFGLLVAERERSKGSAWWARVLPGAFGMLLLVVGLVRLVRMIWAYMRARRLEALAIRKEAA